MQQLSRKKSERDSFHEQKLVRNKFHEQNWLHEKKDLHAKCFTNINQHATVFRKPPVKFQVNL